MIQGGGGRLNPGQKGGQGQVIQMIAAGPMKLEGAERRKLVKEVREELKPLCSQIADFQIEKATSLIKVQIRKIELEFNQEIAKMGDKILREVKSAKAIAASDLANVERELKE